MFQLRWRWPILALLLTGIGYGSKYYTIGGIEHLRLQPRQANGDMGRQNSWETGFSYSGTPMPQPGSSHFAQAEIASEWRSPLPPSPSPSAGQSAAPYMMQHGSARNTLAQSSPIPAPPDFVHANKPQSTPPPIAAPVNNADTDAWSQKPEPRTASLGRLSTARLGTAVTNGPEPVRSAPNSTTANAKNPNTIRVASFQTNGLDPRKMEKREVLDTYAHILSQFDVVALQGIIADQKTMLDGMVEHMNRSGRHFNCLVGPAVGRTYPQQVFAFVYDTDTLETDQRELYTVDDPQDLVSYEPLVAWFQCKHAPAPAAFKFSLVNTQVDANLATREIALLPTLIDAIENDGRSEDDWIIAGDLAGHVRSVLDLDTNVRLALPVTATNIFGTQASDTIFFSAPATVEFTENSGVYDFLRLFNLSIEQASLVSQHLPVWADFSTLEGLHP